MQTEREILFDFEMHLVAASYYFVHPQQSGAAAISVRNPAQRSTL
jgi:hypothetical protein